ncbi:MAG: hypothetical protein GWN86_05135, partial [Desulfobacterales bacterium]|nr:hypothetical protein [Desulfobacterales bacterium]
MLSNRNVQAEWSSRLDVQVTKVEDTLEGTLHIRNGSLTHMFPGGDPVLKQFMVDIILKDGTGKIILKKQIHFGRSFEELLKEGIPR